MTERQRIFISSVQKELAAERRALRDFIANDALLRRFFDVFLFEDLAGVGSARRRGLSARGRAQRHLNVGLFGAGYGFEDAHGMSPTEREFERATALGIERLVFGSSTPSRTATMRAMRRSR